MEETILELFSFNLIGDDDHKTVIGSPVPTLRYSIKRIRFLKAQEDTTESACVILSSPPPRTQTSFSPLQHRNRTLPNPRTIKGRLILDVRFKVFRFAKIDGDDPFLQVRRLDLVRRTRHSRNDRVRDGQAFLQGHLGRLHSVPR